MKNFLSSVFRLPSLIMSLAVFANAYTLADAEKAYVTKDWPTAKAAYAAVCPTLVGKEQISCVYWHALALSQTGKAEDFKAAGKKLDSLISKVSPMDSLYSDLVMTRAQFEIYLKKYVKARESLRHAVESSRNQKNPVFAQVCAMLQKVDKSKDSEELCMAIKEGSLVAVATDSVAEETGAKDSAKAVVNLDSAVSKKDTVVKKESVEKNEAAAPEKVASPEKAAAVEKAPEAVASVEPPPVVEEYALQLGAFSQRSNAEMLVTALKSRDIETRIVERISTDRVLYLVHTGPFKSHAEAAEYGENVVKPLKMDFSIVKNQ